MYIGAYNMFEHVRFYVKFERHHHSLNALFLLHRNLSISAQWLEFDGKKGHTQNEMDMCDIEGEQAAQSGGFFRH